LLAELREIGWRDWDPLQLRNVMLEGQFPALTNMTAIC
jgi:hypothetical protein